MLLGKFDNAFDSIDRSWNAGIERFVCYIEAPILEMSILVHLDKP